MKEMKINTFFIFQEVNDTVEERVVLEYQLDQLKTIGNSDLSD